jgi:putative hydrolase of the HAD superfamily
MILNLKQNSFFIFDLDDTLYPEIEYLKSAYKFIADKIAPVTRKNIYPEMIKHFKAKENVFDWIAFNYAQKDNTISTPYLLKLYREHQPEIKLSEETKKFLERLKEGNISSGLITDGRSITQRNKLKSLGLTHYFKDVIISEEFGSEKPDEKNYLFFKNKYPENNFYFIGDNTSKDFIVPLKLGWFTICLKNKGMNIHEQKISTIFSLQTINSFDDIELKFS